MRKDLELSDPSSCLNRAKDDEPVFVLLARDFVAPSTIEYWAFHRCVNGKNQPGDPQIVDALALAQRMREWKRNN